MSDGVDIASMEARAYRSRWSDGLFDIFFGLSLVWIAVAWLWIESFAGLAGVFPAIFVVPFISFRQRFIESRAGYVKFSERRRNWERRNLIVLALFGFGTFVLGIGALMAFDSGGPLADAIDAIAPGIISFLLALGVLVVAVAAMLPRLFAYAALLITGGVVAALLEANPGMPLLPVGACINVWGAILLARFVSSHPTVEDPVG